MARRGRGAGVRMLAAMALATALVACGEGGPGQLAAPAVAEGDPDFADVLRQRLIDECLVAYLHDDRDAWNLGADGRYVRASADGSGHGAQGALMVRYGKTRRNPPPNTDDTR